MFLYFLWMIFHFSYYISAPDAAQAPSPHSLVLERCDNHVEKDFDGPVTITNGFKNDGVICFEGPVTVTDGRFMNYGFVEFRAHVTIADVASFENHGFIEFCPGVTVTGNERIVNHGTIESHVANVAAYGGGTRQQ